MFERVLHDIISEGITKMQAKPDLLKFVFDLPGRDESELGKLVTAFQTDPPDIVHNYARQGADFPLYAIVLQEERQTQFYVGEEAYAAIDEVAEFVAEVERLTGEVVDPAVQRWQFTYGIFTYSENPDLTVAYYNLLKFLFVGSLARLLDEGAEEPTFSGQDVMPNPQYLPDNAYARMFRITVFGHIFFTTNLDLGPVATGRGTKVRGIHVAEQSEGALALVTPVTD